MKFFKALTNSYKKNTDNVQVERYDYNKVRTAIEDCCSKYLVDSTDILTFEATPKALEWVISVLSDATFLEKYEFNQVNEVLFQVKLREVDLL